MKKPPMLTIRFSDWVLVPQGYECFATDPKGNRQERIVIGLDELEDPEEAHQAVSDRAAAAIGDLIDRMLWPTP